MPAERQLGKHDLGKLEQGEGDSRSYQARILTPEEFLDRVEDLLPRAVQFDAFFMSAQGDPLDRLSPSLVQGAERIGDKLSLGHSRNHQKFVPSNPHNIKPHREERAASEAQFTRIQEAGGLVYDRQAQGARPRFHLRGRAGNIHSKVVQLQTESEVITFIPEFNLTSTHARSENHAIEFVESIENARLEGSVSQTIATYLEKLKSGEPFDDYEVPMGGDMEFLVDSGHMGKSLIAQKVRELITAPTTRDVLWKSQYAPDGPMLDLIRETARQGVAWNIRLSHKHRNNPMGKLFKARIRDLENVHVTYCPKNDTNVKGFVHSKVLLINAGLQRGDEGKWRANPDGQSGILFDGSHNMKRAGWILGTGEVGVVSRNQALFKDMSSFVENELNNKVPEAA